jgi:malonyl-CoA/methylmalonyl-CoA synthetase
MPDTHRISEDPSEWMESAARDFPQRIFLSTPGGDELTYAAAREKSGRFGSALRTLGVVPGDRVAVRVEKSVEAVLLYVACLRLGAVFVPVNVAYSPYEVGYFLRDSRARVAVVDPKDLASLEPVIKGAGVDYVVTLGADGEGSLQDLAGRSPPMSAPEPSVRPESLAAIVYTSGTTGRSKGAMLTRRNLASNAAVLAASWHFTAEDVLLHILPLFHVHGLFAALNTVLVSGASLLLLPKFDPAQVLRHLPEVTVLMGVPTHYTRLLQESSLNHATTGGMRLFVSGSAPLLAETHQEFFRRTGHVILERYGMTETLMNTSNPYFGTRVPGSVGPPLPAISVRVVDQGNGTVQSQADTVGALEVKGPNVFAGYWDDPEKTRAEFTPDGWFKTGDLGRIDSDGYVFIVGRAKDLVITGGYNVYPKEVESELDELPGVLESAVFGVPHPDFGEGVTAAVVLETGSRLTESDIIAGVSERLARYKIPKRVLIVAELPRNAMGKVQKNLLRKSYDRLYSDSRQ